MRLTAATSLMLTYVALFAGKAADTGGHSAASTSTELPAIRMPIRFTMVAEAEVVDAADEAQAQKLANPQTISQQQSQQPYQPPQRNPEYYKSLPQQPIVQYTPQHPYQRACGTTATDICEVPVTIPPGATAEQVYQMANQALGRRQLGEQLAYIRKSAGMGYAPAQYVLGEYYLSHRIAENDWATKGVYWLGQAAAQGDGASEVALGIVYEDGSNNIPRNEAKAIPLLQAAAAQHKSMAEYRIGMDYEFANGLPHNRAQAIQYLRRAAAGGVPTAEAKANFLAKSGTRHYQSAGELEAAMYPPATPRKIKPGECPSFHTYLVGPTAQAQTAVFCHNYPGCPYGGGYLRCAG